MASIGSIAIKMTADATAFIGGLEKGVRGVERFAGDVKRHLGGIVTSVPFIGGAIAAALGGGGLIEMAKSGMDHIIEMGKASARTGVAIQDMGGLILSAGGNVEALEHGMNHFNRTIGEVRAGSAEAAKKFAEMGLDAQAIAVMKPAAAWKIFAEQIKNTSNAADRAKNVQAILGKGGIELLPSLMKGAAGVEAGQARADRTGMTIDAEQLDNVKQAKLSLMEISNLITGIGIQLGAAVAPYVKIVADYFLSAAESAGNMRSNVEAVVDWIALAVAKVMDLGKYFEAAFLLARIGVEQLMSWIATGVEKIFDLLGKLPGAVGESMRNAAEFAKAYSQEVSGLAEADREKFHGLDFSGTAVKAVQDTIAKRGHGAKQAEDAADNLPLINTKMDAASAKDYFSGGAAEAAIDAQHDLQQGMANDIGQIRDAVVGFGRVGVMQV